MTGPTKNDILLSSIIWAIAAVFVFAGSLTASAIVIGAWLVAFGLRRD